ncbi:hypothetical protein F5B19DRAFT_169033 [Rostrohypoxylon terebratum]|nr:hypothetical protein F5B19DRAFT_169033 [Rostrohypoxylon terebratum]
MHGFYANLRISLRVAHELTSFHQTVRHFAWTLASVAVKKGPLSTVQLVDVGEEPPNEVLKISESEHDRFIKALYAFEIASIVLPPVESFGESTRGLILWHGFWKNFLPWEQQQVRCVHRMMECWLSDLIAAQGGFKTSEFSLNNLGQFAISKGVAGLVKLQTGQHGLVEQCLEEFFDKAQYNVLVPRHELWMQGMDAFWLPHDAQADMVGLDPSDKLDSWGSDAEDTGPQDSWLHTLLENRVYNEIFKAGFELQFSCEPCMTEWGYIFWDRAKLEWHSKNCMPTGKEMLAIAKEADPLSTDTFHDRAWGRHSGICPGCPWSARVKAQLGSAHHRFESWGETTGSLV